MSLMDQEEADYAYIRNLFEGWEPDPLPSSAWRGIVQDNSALFPPPTPTGKMEAPTVYAAWALDIDDTEGDFASLSAPARWGRLTVACYTEPGARKGALRRLRRALLGLLDAQVDGALDFDLQNVRVQRVGERGGWYIENFVCPVIGG